MLVVVFVFQLINQVCNKLRKRKNFGKILLFVIELIIVCCTFVKSRLKHLPYSITCMNCLSVLAPNVIVIPQLCYLRAIATTPEKALCAKAKQPGVYFLFDEAGELVYCGSTNYVFARISQHLSARKIDFKQVAFIAHANQTRLDLERYCIQAYRPIHNKVHNPDYQRQFAHKRIINQ